jgi:BMFP domain-containing protein YqiC
MPKEYMSSIAKEVQPVAETEQQTIENSQKRIEYYTHAINHCKPGEDEKIGKLSEKIQEELDVQYAYYEEKSKEAEAAVDAASESEVDEKLNDLKIVNQERAQVMAKTKEGQTNLKQEVAQLEDVLVNTKSQSRKKRMLLGKILGITFALALGGHLKSINDIKNQTINSELNGEKVENVQAETPNQGKSVKEATQIIEKAEVDPTKDKALREKAFNDLMDAFTESAKVEAPDMIASYNAAKTIYPEFSENFHTTMAKEYKNNTNPDLYMKTYEVEEKLIELFPKASSETISFAVTNYEVQIGDTTIQKLMAPEEGIDTTQQNPNPESTVTDVEPDYYDAGEAPINNEYTYPSDQQRMRGTLHMEPLPGAVIGEKDISGRVWYGDYYHYEIPMGETIANLENELANGSLSREEKNLKEKYLEVELLRQTMLIEEAKDENSEASKIARVKFEAKFNQN